MRASTENKNINRKRQIKKIRNRILIGLACTLISGCTKNVPSTIIKDRFTLTINSKDSFKKAAQTDKQITAQENNIDIYLPEDTAATSSLSITTQEIQDKETFTTLYQKNKASLEKLFSWQIKQKEIYFDISCENDKQNDKQKEEKQGIILDNQIEQKETEYFTQAFREDNKKLYITSFFSKESAEASKFIKGTKKVVCK